MTRGSGFPASCSSSSCWSCVVAAIGGLLPALLAAISGSLLANFYFTPPVHTFTIAEGENLLALVVFLVVASVVSWLVSVASRRTADGARARAEAETLAALGGTLVSTEDPLPQLVAQLRAAFEVDCGRGPARAGGWGLGDRGGRRRAGADPAGRGRPSPSRSAGSRCWSSVGERALARGRGGPALVRRAGAGRGRAAPAPRGRRRRGRARRSQRAAHRAARRGLARPPDAVGVDQGVGDEPAPARRRWTPEATREFLETIDEESDRLNALVGNLLDMSRLQTGAMQLVMRDVGLEEVVPRALDSLPDRPVAVVLDLPETLPRVNADAGLLERAVANIIDNARVWSAPDQSVRVEAGVVHERVDLRIIDHGPGIPPGRPVPDLPAVPAARRQPDERHRRRPRPRGRARLRRRDGRRARGRGHPGRRHHHGAQPAGGRPVSRVLVVDDEPQIRRALGINLRARGYDVDLAETGEQALELAAHHHPDVVVLDLGLPGIDGVEVIHGLRGWSQVPVIVLSVREAEADKVAALDAGADDFVTKPFGMDELLARLRAALRRAAPAEEEAVVVTPDFTIDLAAKRVVNAGGDGDPAHADRVAHRRGARAPRGQARRAEAAAPGGVGPDLRDRDELPAGVHGPGAAQARAGAGSAALLLHRARAWATGSRRADA